MDTTQSGWVNKEWKKEEKEQRKVTVRLETVRLEGSQTWKEIK